MKYILKIYYACESEIVICNTLTDALKEIERQLDFDYNVRKVTLKRIDRYV